MLSMTATKRPGGTNLIPEMARATHPPPSMIGLTSTVTRPAPWEATCGYAQEPASPGLVGPARNLGYKLR